MLLREAAGAGNAAAQLELGRQLFAPTAARDFDGSEAALRLAVAQTAHLGAQGLAAFHAEAQRALSMTLRYKAKRAEESGEAARERALRKEAEALLREAARHDLIARRVVSGDEPWIIATREVASRASSTAAVETEPVYFAAASAEASRKFAAVSSAKDRMLALITQLGWSSGEFMRRVQVLQQRRSVDFALPELVAFLEAELAKQRAGGGAD